MQHALLITRLLLLASILISGLAPSAAQDVELFELDDRWTVTVAGQSVAVNPDGTFTIPNVSVPDAFGAEGPGTIPDGVSDDFVRIIAERTLEDGQVLYGFSEYFQLSSAEPYSVADMTLTSTPPLSVCSLAFTNEVVALGSSSGLTAQLTLLATLNGDNGVIDVSSKSDWSTYRSSNASIATVSPDGLVTAVGAGIAFITGVNDGAAAVKVVTVSFAEETSLVGFVFDQSGAPVGGAEVTVSNSSATGFTDRDGRYEITGVAGDLPVIVSATALVDGVLIGGSIGPFEPVAGGITDTGILVASPCQFDDTPGTPVTLSDDDFVAVDITPMGGFPMLGSVFKTAYIGSNGYVTFDQGDTSYFPTEQQLLSAPRVCPLWADLDPSIVGGVSWALAPDSFTVTWSGVPEFSVGGSNTFQVVLGSSGQIDFVYNGVSVAGALGKDALVGVSPSGNASPLAVSLSEIEDVVQVPAGVAAFEVFSAESVFDLDFSCLRYSPNELGGYDVTSGTLALPLTASVTLDLDQLEWLRGQDWHVAVSSSRGQSSARPVAAGSSHVTLSGLAQPGVATAVLTVDGRVEGVGHLLMDEVHQVLEIRPFVPLDKSVR